jgi:hypothetical protein
MDEEMKTLAAFSLLFIMSLAGCKGPISENQQRKKLLFDMKNSGTDSLIIQWFSNKISAENDENWSQLEAQQYYDTMGGGCQKIENSIKASLYGGVRTYWYFSGSRTDGWLSYAADTIVEKQYWWHGKMDANAYNLKSLNMGILHLYARELIELYSDWGGNCFAPRAHLCSLYCAIFSKAGKLDSAQKYKNDYEEEMGLLKACQDKENEFGILQDKFKLRESELKQISDSLATIENKADKMRLLR